LFNARGQHGTAPKDCLRFDSSSNSRLCHL
jgi:hypothetical protein